MQSNRFNSKFPKERLLSDESYERVGPDRASSCSQHAGLKPSQSTTLSNCFCIFPLAVLGSASRKW